MPNIHVYIGGGYVAGAVLWSSFAADVVEDQDVTIDGITVLMDVNSVSIGELSCVNGGILKWVTGYNGVLTAANIHQEGGHIHVGTEASPYVGSGGIILTGVPEVGNAHPRQNMLHNGAEFIVYANTRDLPYALISDDIAEDGTEATIDDAYDISGWQGDDDVAISATDWRALGGSDVRTLTGKTGQTLEWASGIAFRWGKRQYMTDAGLSLTPGTFTAEAGVPDELEERAVVANLTRNFFFRSIQDAYWVDDGFGCGIMVMDRDCKLHLDGLEVRYCGQAGILGRYPIHGHQLSYYPDGHAQEGQYKGAVPEGNFVVKNCCIRDSVQRMVVLHAMDGGVVTRNVGYNIRGHAIFQEAGVEQGNTITYNCVMKVQEPLPGMELLNHDLANGEAGPTAFWNANPNNNVSHNIATDCDGPGFWNAFPAQAWADMTSVAIFPNHVQFGTQTGNRSMSNRGPGMLGRNVQVDAEGTVTNSSIYGPTSDETGSGTRLNFEITSFTATKNAVAYAHSTDLPNYKFWAVANNDGTHFVGKTGVPDDTTPQSGIRNNLIVGLSLNSANPYMPGTGANTRPGGVVSYHSTIPIVGNTFAHFPEIIVDNYGSGGFKADDYYVKAVERGTYFDTDNQYIDAFKSYRTLPPNLDGVGDPERNFTYAGAIWDEHGQRTGFAGRYWVFNDTFLTYGGGTSDDVPTTELAAGENGKAIIAEYYGAENFSTNWDNSNPFQFVGAMTWKRLNDSYGEEGEWVINEGTIGTQIFPWMRHAALRKSGKYLVDLFKSGVAADTTTQINFLLTNLSRSDDSVLIGFAFDTSAGISAYYGTPGLSSPPGRRILTDGGSLAAVVAGDGTLYFKDSGRVWILFKGDISRPAVTEGTWAWLYQDLEVSISKV